MLSTDGKLLRDSQEGTQSISIVDELTSINQRLDAVLPAVRPRERLGGLAAARASDSENARARIEGTYAIDPMRAADQSVRAIATAHQVKLQEIRTNPGLTEHGKRLEREKAREALDKQLIGNSNTYIAAESELLKTFPGRSTAVEFARMIRVCERLQVPH